MKSNNTDILRIYLRDNINFYDTMLLPPVHCGLKYVIGCAYNRTIYSYRYGYFSNRE